MTLIPSNIENKLTMAEFIEFLERLYSSPPPSRPQYLYANQETYGRFKYESAYYDKWHKELFTPVGLEHLFPTLKIKMTLSLNCPECESPSPLTEWKYSEYPCHDCQDNHDGFECPACTYVIDEDDLRTFDEIEFGSAEAKEINLYASARYSGRDS